MRDIGLLYPLALTWAVAGFWPAARDGRADYNGSMRAQIENIHFSTLREPPCWQIPCHDLSAAQERSALADSESYSRLLTAMGFVCATRVFSGFYGLHHKTSPPPAATFFLWYHPAGVIVSGRTCANSNRMDSVTAHLQIEVGTGAESQHLTSVRLAGVGNGGMTRTLDGNAVRGVLCGVREHDGSLVHALQVCQRHGRIVPFARWMPGIADPVYCHAELVIPLANGRNTALPGTSTLAAARESFLERLPADVADAMRTPRCSPPGHECAVLAENVLKQFSEALFLDGRRWHEDIDSDLLCHWTHVALGERGRDPRDWRAYENGPAGLSLPAALLYAGEMPRLPDDMDTDVALLDLLAQVPKQVLRRWAQVPDAAGYTLGLHAVNRLFLPHVLPETAARASAIAKAVVEVLHARLGNRGLPMATQRRSVLGIALQGVPALAAQYPQIVADNHARLNDLLETFESWRLPWNRHLRWRSYPNIFRGKDEGQPQFFRIDGRVDAQRWQQCCTELGLTTDAGIAERLCRQGLRRAHAAAPAPDRPAARPGL